MVQEYTLEKHILNLELLEKLYGIAGKCSKDVEFFELINMFADFIQENKQYSFIESFNTATDLLVEIINFCNSSDYNSSKFIELYNSIIIYIEKIKEEVIDKYSINVYFKGIDKYRILEGILNPNVNFIDNLHENNVFLKKDSIEFSVLLISEETTTLKKESICNFDKIIYYDKLMNELFNISEQIYYSNYDYNYLINTIAKGKKNEIETIFVGSSYSLYGIDEIYFNENIVNLSLPSEDIYYSYKIAKEIIDNNKNIKKCYIGTGYWSFHFDLSKSIKSEVARIENVYYPVFKDSNNYEYINKKKIQGLKDVTDKIINTIIDMNRLYNYFSTLIYNTNKTYFNSKMTRQFHSILRNYNINSISEEEKFLIGRERAETHNKLLKHNQTKIETEYILDKFLEYLGKKNVSPIIINFPTSKYYNKFLNKEFIIEYYNIINNLKLKYNFTFIDLLSSTILNNDDFIDMDHISDTGARKISKYLNELFIDL